MLFDHLISSKSIIALLASVITSFILAINVDPVYAIDIADGDILGLIEAIEIANAGGDPVINLAPNGIYEFDAPYIGTLDNALPPITGTVIINGNGSSLIRNQATANEFRFFNIEFGARLTLNHITLENGYLLAEPGNNAQGGAVYNAGMLTLSETIFVNNMVEVEFEEVISGIPENDLAGNGQGGAIYNAARARIVEINNSIFDGNVARGSDIVIGVDGGDGQGGAIYNQGTIVDIIGTRFEENFAESGATYIAALFSAAEGQGGAIYNGDTGYIRSIIGNTNFTQNAAHARFGLFATNAAGGALWNIGQIAKIEIVEFIQNHAALKENEAPSLFTGEFLFTEVSIRSILGAIALLPPVFLPPNVLALIQALANRIPNINDICTIIICTPIVKLGSGVFGGNNRGGAIYNQGEILSLNTIMFDSNQSLGTSALLLYGGNASGGAIHNEVGANLRVQVNLVFFNNTARGGRGVSKGGSGRGGAIYNGGFMEQINKGIFAGNIAQGDLGFPSPGNALGFLNSVGNQDLFKNLPFIPNFARSTGGDGEGGAIYLAPQSGFLDISSTEFIGNQTISGFGGTNSGKSRGGAIFRSKPVENLLNSLLLQIRSEVLLDGNLATGLEDVVLINPIANNPSQGGALYIDGGRVVIEGVDIVNNIARGPQAILGLKQGQGGAIFINQGIVSIGDATNINSNQAVGGFAGIAGVGGSGEGGAIYNLAGNLSITNTNINRNMAQGGEGLIGGGAYGGGIYSGGYVTFGLLMNGDLLTFDGVMFIDGIPFLTFDGEPLLLDGEPLQAEDVMFTPDGIVIIINGETFTLGPITTRSATTVALSRIENNEARGNVANRAEGGGIYNSGNLQISSTTIDSNFSIGQIGLAGCVSWGGGLANELGGIALIGRSAIINNSNLLDQPNANIDDCDFLGGAIFNGRISALPDSLLSGISNLTLVNTTISNNNSPELGGGLFNEHVAELNFVTMVRNEAAQGGGLYLNGETTRINNSIISGNGGGDCLHEGGVFQAVGLNIDEDGSCREEYRNIVSIPLTELLLGELRVNAPGRTETYALLDGSPAIGQARGCVTVAGVTVEGDQRGASRIERLPCDIGAYEADILSPSGFIVFDPGISKLGLLMPGQTGLTGERIRWIVKVTNNGSTVANNVIVTDSLHPGLQIDQVQTTKGTATIVNQTVSIAIPSLAPGETVLIDIYTTVINGAISNIDNTACVTALSSDIERCATSSVVRQLPITGNAPWYFEVPRFVLSVLLISILLFSLTRVRYIQYKSTLD